MAEEILTLHPRGKSGRTVDKGKYNQMRTAILRGLCGRIPLTHAELLVAVKKELKAFDGNIPRFVETVRLDLEARRLVYRIDTDPPKYRRKQHSFVPRHGKSGWGGRPGFSGDAGARRPSSSAQRGASALRQGPR
ncbi:MAG: hypothetical protein V1735_05095 [Nanoarchaeota archaeon]